VSHGPAKGIDLVLRSFFLSLRLDGVGPTLRRLRARLFGIDQRYVFVRSLKVPAKPVHLPVEDKSIAVRLMEPVDRTDLRLRQHEPPESRGPCDAIVATSQGRIVGAAWYADVVTAEQPWFEAVRPHVVEPSRFTASIFVVPGEKAAAYTIAKAGSDWLATKGVRSIVGMVGATNKPSILMTRLLGGKMVGRVTIRSSWGRRTTEVERLEKDVDTALRGGE
jgi:hypothetical protein